MDRIENEIKVLVDGEQAFRTVGALLLGNAAALPSPVMQVNRFFDTTDRALRRGGFMLRLREQEDRFILTAKGPPSRVGVGDGLMSKAEEEIEITTTEGRHIREGETSPLDMLESRLPKRPALLRAIRATVAERRLTEVGAFRNERRSLGALDLDTAAGTASLLLEMDRTEFPGDRVDHEIEAEILDGSPEAALARVRDLFREAGLEWRPSTSKSRRFFAALEAQPG